MYKPKHFIVQELVPKEIYDRYKEDSLIFIDNRILITLDYIRDYFNVAVLVNNWHQGGLLDERCFRLWSTSTGARLSQHKLGKAVDYDVVGLTAEEVRQEILANQDSTFFKYITRMELGTSWNHNDVKSIYEPQQRIYTFNP